VEVRCLHWCSGSEWEIAIQIASDIVIKVNYDDKSLDYGRFPKDSLCSERVRVIQDGFVHADGIGSIKADLLDPLEIESVGDFLWMVSRAGDDDSEDPKERTKWIERVNLLPDASTEEFLPYQGVSEYKKYYHNSYLPPLMDYYEGDDDLSIKNRQLNDFLEQWPYSHPASLDMIESFSKLWSHKIGQIMCELALHLSPKVSPSLME